MNADGGNRVRITDTSADVINITPSWSPDKSKIAFARHNNVTGKERGIFVSNADGSNLTRLTNSDGRGYDFGPVWSPDGRKIAYYSDNSGKEQIIVMNRDGSDATTITGDAYRSASPHWSPDGSRIVYSSNQNVASSQYVGATCDALTGNTLVS